MTLNQAPSNVTLNHFILLSSSTVFNHLSIVNMMNFSVGALIIGSVTATPAGIFNHTPKDTAATSITPSKILPHLQPNPQRQQRQQQAQLSSIRAIQVQPLIPLLQILLPSPPSPSLLAPPPPAASSPFPPSSWPSPFAFSALYAIYASLFAPQSTFSEAFGPVHLELTEAQENTPASTTEGLQAPEHSLSSPSNSPRVMRDEWQALLVQPTGQGFTPPDDFETAEQSSDDDYSTDTDDEKPKVYPLSERSFFGSERVLAWLDYVRNVTILAGSPAPTKLRGLLGL
ncbi:hypothetical protein QBC38DRAFT_449036 [Podospora fimiseda]|uniref:Uncharacterized protein n=1 Tax=Podospora fimiseda TaxID=252190 RepID=A0AAN6YRQ9_9PEZI|nr:hypothetical protein QBC38DRAFT_449036 [Podospora fimiseda]